MHSFETLILIDSRIQAIQAEFAVSFNKNSTQKI